WAWKRQGLSELLQNPVARRMRGGVEMENAAPMLLDDEEAVQHTEAQRGHGKEVEGSDHLTVVLEECQPALHLRFVGLALQLLQIARHGRVPKPQILVAVVPHGCAARPRMDSRTSCAESTAESRR